MYNIWILFTFDYKKIETLCDEFMMSDNLVLFPCLREMLW